MGAGDGLDHLEKLRRVGTFVLIVWAVAATFVGFELASARGMELVLAHPAAFGPILLSRATQASTACDIHSGERPATSAAITPSEARAAAWVLGFRTGQNAQVRMSPRVTAEARRASEEGIAQMATALKVPVPNPFDPRQIAQANTEFVSFIETEGGTTAHQLALVYSPDACRLFKLGAFWGYASVARMSLPGERSIYAIEIRYYASALQLPNSLWQPIVDPTPRAATAEEINAQSLGLTVAVTRYLSNQQ